MDEEVVELEALDAIRVAAEVTRANRIAGL